MKNTNEIDYMEVNLLQKESGKFKRFDVQIPFGVIRSKAHLSDTDLNLISPYFDNAKELQIIPVLLKPCSVVPPAVTVRPPAVTVKPPALIVRLLAKYPVP